MKKNLIIFGLVGSLFCGMNCFADTYSNEYINAYNYAYVNGITTSKSINKANMNGTLTRIAMAKMISQYAMNVLLLEPDTTINCSFGDVTSSLDLQYNNGVTLACQLGLMGMGANGSISKNFNPYDTVTRGQWATVLSRALSRVNGDVVNEGNPFYKPHMNYLQSKGIIKSVINPPHDAKEKRGNAMLMLMRATQDEDIDSGRNDDTQRIGDIIKDYNGVILNGSDLRPNTATNSEDINVKKSGGYTTITVNLTGGTFYVDYDYNFLLKINADGINVNTLELSYNDYSKLTTFYIYGNNKNHFNYANLYSRTDYLSECKKTNQYGFNDLETNFQIWGGNDKYIFIRGQTYRNIDSRMKLFTNTDSLKELVEKKHCDCKSCRVEEDYF